MNKSVNNNANRTHELRHETLGVFLVKLMNKFLGLRR
ncbi:MAG: hypothetical protein ACJA2S_001200 [Cyclobacteriaceae bacterium]|jgi:hypothetical protein